MTAVEQIWWILLICELFELVSCRVPRTPCFRWNTPHSQASENYGESLKQTEGLCRLNVKSIYYGAQKYRTHLRDIIGVYSFPVKTHYFYRILRNWNKVCQTLYYPTAGLWNMQHPLVFNDTAWVWEAEVTKCGNEAHVDSRQLV